MGGMNRHDSDLLKSAKNQHKLCPNTCYLGSVIDLAERLAAENAAIMEKNDAFKTDNEAGNLVRLPGELIAPYELNARYWICGWDSERCTLTIQDRVLMDESNRVAFEGAGKVAAVEIDRGGLAPDT